MNGCPRPFLGVRLGSILMSLPFCLLGGPRPPETRPAAWNRTVRACCPGWGGSHCTLSKYLRLAQLCGFMEVAGCLGKEAGSRLANWVCLIFSPLPTIALAEAKPKGHCFATRQCQPGTGSANASAGSLEECCALPWGQSWRDGRSQACLNCSSQQRPGGPPACQ